MNKLYLAHHGIKGQKWGERNGPPYPLKRSYKSKSRTGIFNKKTNISQPKTKEVERPEHGPGCLSSNRELVGTFMEKDYRISGRHDSFAISIDPETGKTLELKYLPTEEAVKVHRQQYEEFLSRRDDHVSDLKKIKPATMNTEITDMQKDINPNYGNSIGNSMNCVNCSIAFCMRLKGYDVKARTVYSGYQDTLINDVAFKNDKIAKYYTRDDFPESTGRYISLEDIANSINKEFKPTKGLSYGVLGVGNDEIGGGHEIAWARKGNGPVEFYDAQNGKSVSEYGQRLITTNFTICDLTTATPTDAVLAHVESSDLPERGPIGYVKL